LKSQADWRFFYANTFNLARLLARTFCSFLHEEFRGLALIIYNAQECAKKCGKKMKLLARYTKGERNEN
jgi:hypothetical protein